MNDTGRDQSTRGSESGFTLVEALVAVVVLVFGLMAVTNLMLVAASSNTVANQGTAAVTSATRAMDMVKSTTHSDLRLNPGGVAWETSPGGGPSCDTAIVTDWHCDDNQPGGRTNSHPLVGQRHRRCAPAVHPGPIRGHGGPGRGPVAGGVHHVPCLHQLRRGRLPGRAMRTAMSIKSRASEGGFSLVELMVAMTVTLIVSGAIYGLLTSGGNAFRREPEMADRQQNIRVAMDLISRDVFNAGAALPTYAQVFSRSDPGSGPCAGGLNGCGPAGTMGPTAAAGRGDATENTDVLELVAADERCPVQTVCSIGVQPGSAGAFVTREGVPACMTLPGLVLLADQHLVHGAAGGRQCRCRLHGRQRDAQRQPDARGLPRAVGRHCPRWPRPTRIRRPPRSPSQVFLYRGRVVRYMIAPGTDPLDPSPSLWRSESGLYTTAGAAAPAPGAANSPWELVARGIEDLQIEYSSGVPTAVWANEPPISTTTDWSSIVRAVRISLSARVTAANLQGETVAAGGGAPNAIRGQLVTVVAPRAGFNELQMGNQIQ